MLLFLPKNSILILRPISKGIVDISPVKAQDILIFSHISYALKSIEKGTIKNEKFTVYLTKQSEQLDEVVCLYLKEMQKQIELLKELLS